MTLKLGKFTNFKALFPAVSKAFFEGLIFGGAYIRRSLSTDGNLPFKIDWASLMVGSRFTVFALFYVVFAGNFLSTSPWGLIFGGAYTWRGLFSEFYGISLK